MKLLRAWLRQQGIEIATAAIVAGGMVEFTLILPNNRELEVRFWPYDAKHRPAEAIARMSSNISEAEDTRPSKVVQLRARSRRRMHVLTST